MHRGTMCLVGVIAEAEALCDISLLSREKTYTATTEFILYGKGIRIDVPGDAPAFAGQNLEGYVAYRQVDPAVYKLAGLLRHW